MKQVYQPKEFLTCTRILYIMTILGIMANYMLRVNLSMAIIDMIQPPNSTTEGHKFDWDRFQKNDLLGIFFWGYILTDIIGGRLAELFGPKKIFGYGMLVASVITIITPLACDWDYYAAMAARFGIGLSLGVTFPCLAPLAVNWIAPSDISKFMSNMLAQGIGVAVSLPTCGYLITTFGWPSVFYFTGCLGGVWCLGWFYFVYDSPESHPRISEAEREEICEKVKGKKRTDQVKLPWLKLLASPAVWSVLIVHGSLGFCHFMIITQLPTYMKDVLNFNLRKNGLMSSLPSLGQYFLALIAAYSADKIIKSKALSKLWTRKLFVILSCIVPSILTVALVVWGRNEILALILINISFACIGLMSGGHLPNPIDIAPNFSGTIMGLATTLASLAGAVSTKIVAVITRDESTFNTWRYVFAVMAGVYAFGGLFYIIFGRATIQTWSVGQCKKEKRNEMVPLSVISQ